jgi:hypothetical protein
MVKNYRIEGVVAQRQFVKICPEKAGFRFGNALPWQSTGLEMKTVSNHAPAHGISEIGLASCPEQSVPVKAPGALSDDGRLLRQQATAAV